MGAWTPVAYYSERDFPTQDEALAAARAAVPWLADVLDRSSLSFTAGESRRSRG
jgi:hypothetical protein